MKLQEIVNALYLMSGFEDIEYSIKGSEKQGYHVSLSYKGKEYCNLFSGDENFGSGLKSTRMFLQQLIETDTRINIQTAIQNQVISYDLQKVLQRDKLVKYVKELRPIGYSVHAWNIIVDAANNNDLLGLLISLGEK
ncbi:hypothetical protein [Proteus mirabilis]|uniref:hypothetical protein n=1 Tax=Proteus mirabilis TaxID=584 RepID=UPI0034D3ABBF